MKNNSSTKIKRIDCLVVAPILFAIFVILFIIFLNTSRKISDWSIIEIIIALFILSFFLIYSIILFLSYFFYYIEISEDSITEHIFFKKKLFVRKDILSIVSALGDHKNFGKNPNDVVLFYRINYIIILKKRYDDNDICTRQEIYRRMKNDKNNIIFKTVEYKKIILILEKYGYNIEKLD